MKDSNYLLTLLATLKSEIQTIQLYIDGARTDKIARARYARTKGRLKELVAEHKRLTIDYNRQVFGK